MFSFPTCPFKSTHPWRCIKYLSMLWSSKRMILEAADLREATREYTQSPSGNPLSQLMVFSWLNFCTPAMLTSLENRFYSLWHFPGGLSHIVLALGTEQTPFLLCSSGNMVSFHLFSQKVMSSSPPTPIRNRDHLNFPSWHRIVMDSSMTFQLLQLCYDIIGARWI